MRTIERELEIILAHSTELTASGLDYVKLGLWAGGLPDSRILALDPKLPPEELEARLKAFLYHEEPHPVLLAALDPYHRARNIIYLLTEKFAINPELLTVVDLQEALGYQDPRACSLKAHHLIRLAAAIVSRAQPITTQEVPVSSQVLVWGDSGAALKAALDLARLGYPVLLAFPGPALKPLNPGGPMAQAAEEELASLVSQAQAHTLIRLLPEAAVLDLQGGAGDFVARLKSRDRVLEEKVGALILAPELMLKPAALSPDHPRVIPLTRLEEILGAPDETAALLNPEAPQVTVALLADAGGDGQPLALSRTLGAAGWLLSRENCQPYLFLRDAKVAAPGLETALEEAQTAGLMVIKVNQPPALSPDGDRLRLTFFDPVMRQEMSLACDLAVQAEAYGAAPESAALAELLRLHPGPLGFFQSDNVRNLPVTTNRRGIYAAGPGRAIMDLDQAFGDADAAVTEVQRLLGQGMSPAPKGRAVIDRGRCVLCLTCHRLCPHGAITWDNRAIINELACQGCGVCASQCPNEAIQIHNFTDDQVVAALSTIDPRLTPRIIAFMCKNSAWEAYHAALNMDHAPLPLGFTPMRMPCAGKIDIDYLLQAFALGADGVLVLGCHPDNCKSQQGNEHALWRVERARDLLAEAGVDPQRLLFQTLAPNSPRDFLAAVDLLMENLAALKAA